MLRDRFDRFFCCVPCFGQVRPFTAPDAVYLYRPHDAGEVLDLALCSNGYGASLRVYEDGKPVARTDGPVRDGPEGAMGGPFDAGPPPEGNPSVVAAESQMASLDGEEDDVMFDDVIFYVYVFFFLEVPIVLLSVASLSG